MIITAFYLLIKPTLFFEPPWLLPIMNTLFVTVVCFIVAYIAMRNYKATGRIQILLLGCGVLAFGIGGVVAGLLRSVPGTGANLNVTVYNTSALVGAIFHFFAALLLLAGISPEAGSKRKGAWLVFSYVGLTLFMALFSMASLNGMIPPFFIQGVGPTPLRQAVLGTADILFAFSFLIFMGTYLRNREVFLYWYSSALALTSISLTGFFIQSAVGSPIGWASRFSQYLGGIYFLVAIITAIRSAQARRISFDNVITASLSPAEEKFRALADNSPDIIDRFDREMRHLYVNRAGLKFFGKPAAKMIGSTLEETGLPETYCKLWKERIQKVLETGQPMEVEDYLSTPSGMGFYQSHCVPEYGVDGNVANVLVVSRDLTARKQAEEGIRRQNMVLEGINRIFRETLSSHTDEQLGQTCLAVAEELTQSKFGFIGEIGADGLLHDIAISDPGWELCTIYDKTGHRRVPGNFKVHGLYGRVLQDGKSLIANEPSSHADRIGVPEGHPPLTAFLGVPLIRDGKAIGMIAVGNRKGGYRAEDQETLEALAPATMGAFARKRAEQAVKQRTFELQRLTESLEQRVRDRTEDLARANEALRHLSSRLLSAQEDERKRIAGELHDTIGSCLSGVKFKVENTLQQIGKAANLGTESLRAIIPVIQEGIEECRRMQTDLRPSMLDDLGLVPTLSWFCRRFQTIYTGMKVELEQPLEESEIPNSLKIVIYRVVQEAMNNIAKHSQADLVRLSLHKMDGNLELVLEDNGQGFDMEKMLAADSTRRGLGLTSMRERTELSGGSFAIESTEGRGTIIRASWLPGEKG